MQRFVLTCYLVLGFYFQNAYAQSPMWGAVQVNDGGGPCTLGLANTSKNVATDDLGNIYIAYSSPDGVRVAKSADRGFSFLPSILIDATTPSEPEIHVADNGYVHVAFSSGGTYFLSTSTNAGATFSSLTSVGGGWGGCHMASYQNMLYLIDQNGSFLYINNNYGSGGFSSYLIGGYAYADVFTHPTTGDVIVTADNPNLFAFRSTDNGATFNPITLSGFIPIFYSSYALSTGPLGDFYVVSGQGSDANRIDLNTGIAQPLTFQYCAPSTERTLIADEYGNVVDGYQDGTDIWFRHSFDQGTTWDFPINVANSPTHNIFRNAFYADIVVAYQTGGNIYCKVYDNILRSLTTQTLSTDVICQNTVTGNPLAVTYSVGVPFITGNTFSLQLSDNTGSFASPVTIGVVSSTTSGVFAAVLPATLTPGMNYKMRTVGSNPPITGPESITTLTITSHPIVTASNGTICAGESFTIVPGGASTYTYSSGPVVFPAASSNYSVRGTSSFGCVSSNTAVVNVLVNGNPTLNITGSSSFCIGSSVTQTISGADTYTWSSGQMTSTVSLSPSSNTVYTIAGKNSLTGCTATIAKSITVHAIPVISVNSGSICNGNVFTITPNGAQTYTISGGSVTVSPSNDAVYTVAGTNSLGCVSAISASASIQVKPLPVPLIVPTQSAICVGQSATLTAITATTNALSFDGADDYVSVPYNAAYNTTNFTTEFWVKPNTYSSIHQSPLTQRGYFYGYAVYLDPDNNWSVLFGYASNWQGLGGPKAMLNEWTHLALSYDGSVMTFYVNGVAVSSTVSPYYPNPSYEMRIGTGATEGWPQYYFNGQVDEVRIWNVPHNAAQIQSDMNSCLIGSESGLVAYYPMNNGPGSAIITDESPAFNDGAFNNMSVVSGWTTGVSNCNLSSFAWTPGAITTKTMSVAPATSTGYNVNVTNIYGCSASGARTIVVNTLPVLAVSGTNSLCFGSSVTQTLSGADTYTWSTGSIANPEVLSPTSNTVYVISGTSTLTGCTNTASRSLTVNPALVITVNSGSICSGNVFTMSPSGASTYTFSSGSSTVSPLSDTNYSVTGTDVLGCNSTGVATSSVIVRATPVVTVNSGTICTGKSFTFVPTGASTYNFLTGGPVVSPTIASSYSITGTSIFGCPSSNTAVSNVAVNSLPVLSVAGIQTLCLGSSLSQTVSGANTYTWSTGLVNNIATLNPTANTIYTITGTDAVTTCSNTTLSSIIVYALPVVSVNSGSICSGKTFTMLPTGALFYTFSNGSNTVAPLSDNTYSVTGTNALGCVSASAAVATISVKATPTVAVNSGAICVGKSFTIVPSGASTYTYLNGISVISPTITSSYSIVGTSTAGCVSQNTAVSTVVVNALPSLSITGLAAVCSGSAISQTAGGADTYSWSTGSTIATIAVSPTVNTLYNLSGTITATGCFSSISKMINVGPIPVITVNSGNVCAGGVFTMTPHGASTYTFSDGTSLVSSTVLPTANTSYYVSGTSALGCVSTSSAISNVLINAAPIIIVNSGGVCAGEIFTMTPTGASTYTFSNGTSTTLPTSDESYTITGTDVLGCTSATSAVAHVTVHPLPTIIAADGTICIGSHFNITPSGAATYTYISQSGPVSSWVTPTTNASYSVTGTSIYGCVSSNTEIVTLDVTPLPTLTVNSSTVCAGSVFTINPSGADTYTYSSGTATVAPLGNTSYSVIGTNSLGCVSAPAVANVTLLAAPFVMVNSGTICAGEVFTIIPSGADTYTISGLSTTVSPSTNSSYSVTGTNILGCQSSNAAMALVVVNALPSLGIIGNPVICAGKSTSLIATGANSYTWSTNYVGSVESFSPNTNTSYSVSGTNSDGCIGSTSVMITVNVLPTLTLNSGTVCPSSPFVILPSGGVTYTYSGGSNVVTPSVTTSYSVTGTNVNGCVTASAAITTITVLNTTSISVSGNTVLCAGSTASLSVSGANSYTWSSGEWASSVNLTPSATTDYSVVGFNGTCGDTTYVSVIVNPVPQLSITSTSSLICTGENVILSSEGANVYSWNTGETTMTLAISPTITTTYTVTGTENVNGCVNSATITQSVSKCTAIDNDDSGQMSFIQLFPNPNNGEFIIESSKQVQMLLTNSLGQPVLQRELEEGKNAIMLNEIAKGIYFVVFKDGSYTSTVKFIKQ